MVEYVFFWVVAPIMVLASLTLLFVRKAVHVAAAMVVVMVCLAVTYIHLEAPFLGFVQIIVYTGAVMMLFLFVLMLVGVDQREHLREVIKYQRWIALLGAAGLAFVLISVIARVTIYYQPIGDLNNGGNPQAVATVLFHDYAVVIELLGVLLVVAAVGALLLTLSPPMGPPSGQRAKSEERVRGRLNPVNKPMPGVYARHNALDIPALDPLGNPLAISVSRVLRARHQDKEGEQWKASRPDAIDKRKDGKS